jgi:hypothetical protein
LLRALAAALPAAAGGPSLELGVQGGGGLAFAFGPLVDDEAAALAAAGSVNGAGTAAYEPTPAWTGGLYAGLRLADWFKVGLAPRVSYLGTTLLASVDGAAAWERWSIAMPAILVPLNARFCLRPAKAWEIEAWIGPELAILAGDTTILETYARTSLKTVLAVPRGRLAFLAAGAGLEARLLTAAGWLKLGAGCDIALTPAGHLEAAIHPAAVNLYLGWGWELPLTRSGAAAAK